MLKLCVIGAGGRMGRRIVALALESGNFEISSAIEVTGNALIGQDIGVLAGVGELNVLVSDTIATKPDVIIDFALPDKIDQRAKYASDNNVPWIVGTTGLSPDEVDILKQASKTAPVLLGANMSLGVNLLFKLVGQVAKALGDNYDIECVEHHHRFKRDAPSGTALELGRHIAEAKDWPFPECITNGRDGKEALREDKTIGMHAVRAGDIVGEHSVMYSALGETIELRHRAHTRDTFVRGALHAAKWLSKKPAGYYTMFDVLEL